MRNESLHMRTILRLLCFALICCPAFAFDHSHAQFGTLLQKYVRNGSVDYLAMKASATLATYLDQLAAVKQTEFQQWTKEQQLAFLINLYNAQTIQLILDHYPVKSIKDIQANGKGPWDLPVVRLFGQAITLNSLENEIIRKNYAEPRIHFALVCAARGCPPLLSEPYRADQLSRQLDSQTRKFLLQTGKNFVDANSKTIHISPIFQWYEPDFVNAAGSVQSFLARYIPRRDLAGYKIVYTFYDWTLNQV